MMMCEESTKPKTVRFNFTKGCVLSAFPLIPFYISFFCSISVLFMDPLVGTVSSSLNPYNTHTIALSTIVSVDTIYDRELSFRIHSYLRNPAWKFYFSVNDKRDLGKMTEPYQSSFQKALMWRGKEIWEGRYMTSPLTLSGSTFWKITPKFPALFVCLFIMKNETELKMGQDFT